MSTSNSTTTDRLLEMAYDMEQQGNPIAAAGLRRMAHDPSFFATVVDVLTDLPPVAEHPMILAARAYDQAPTPEHYAAMAREWEAAGLPVKDDDDDEDGRVVFTDDSRPVKVERVEMGRDRAWLDFRLDDGDDTRMLVSVDVVGGRPGVKLIICNDSLNPYTDHIITLDQLRQIHADLGAMLADERLVAALGGTLVELPVNPVRAAVLAALAIEDDDAQRAALATIPNADWEALGTTDPIIGAAYHAGGTIAIRDYRRLRSQLG